VTRPIKELKGFQKIALKKGATQTVTFEISVEELKFYNADLEFIAEPGDFQVFVGTNSDADKMLSFKLIK
jgi:beta-glucosidase